MERSRQDTPEPWVSVAEVIKHTGLSRATINRQLRECPEPLPSKKIGGRRLYQLSAVDAWLRRRGRPRETPMANRIPLEGLQRKFTEMFPRSRARKPVPSLRGTLWDVRRRRKA